MPTSIHFSARSPARCSAVEHRGVELFPFFSAPRPIFFPGLAQGKNIFLCSRRQADIPTKESRLAVLVQPQALATPVSRFERPADRDIHKVVAGRAKRPVRHAPMGKPRLAGKIQEKIPGPVHGTGKVERRIAVRDQHPAGVDIPRFFLESQPRRPDLNREAVREENESRLLPTPRPRAFDLQSLEIFLEFDTCHWAEASPAKFTLEP